jgi:nitroimidazol reductase NimA-like FMN-containing flavoprotein (pyridoxamine 5'-phosphate oxidase superfamily)
MRRLDKEVKDEKVIREIFEDSQVLRIGFAIDGVPYIVPVNYAYADGHLCIHSAPAGNKIEMIKKNDRVCFEMELYDEIMKAEKACNWTTKYRSVIGWGTIRVSDEKDEKIRGLDLIMKKYGWKGKTVYGDGMLNNMVLLLIEIDHFTAKQSGYWE